MIGARPACCSADFDAAAFRVTGAIPPHADRPFRVGLALTMPGVRVAPIEPYLRREWRMALTESDCSFGQFGGLDLPPTTDPASRRSASGLGNTPTQQEVTSV